MFTFLLIVHALIAAAMVGVILMQRSEGGGLTGGSPAGLISARGAADLLTRATTVLATLFVLLSIVLAAYAAGNRTPDEIDTSLARQGPASAPLAAPVPGDLANGAAPAAPAPVVPLATGPQQPATSAPARPAQQRSTAAPAPRASTNTAAPATPRETAPAVPLVVQPTVAPAAPAAATPPPATGNSN